MKSSESHENLKREKRKWETKTGRSERRREAVFTTVSGEPVETLYTPDDISEMNYLTDLGFPGEFPYTRGVHQSMYRGKLWTMRQFAGFGTPEDTNERF
ncbi:MAG TPA: methylmalonyl-CoA mutase family protein, partial [Bacteroidota bacterium]|nr:methylmalonyl-CoA mutase family protein [Bacteroidota bacterium]